MAEDTPTTEEGVAAPAAGDAGPEESASGRTDGADGANATNTKSSASAQQPNKKRRPGIQLNKDDHPEGHECNSDDDDDINDEGGKRTDPFKRASEDVLKKRKIVKASNKWGGGAGGNGGKSGLFGAVKLAPATAVGVGGDEKKVEPSKSSSVFGSALGGGGSSGFGSAAGTSSGFGFGNVSSGFGSLKPTKSDSDKTDNGEAKSSGFGGGEGSLGFGNAASSGFGSLKTTGGFGFGSATDSSPSVAPGAAASSSNGSGLAGTFATSSSSNKTNGSSLTKFPTSAVVDTANGEQDEDCVYQVRAKLFKMVPEDDTPETEEKKAEYDSVPSTSRALEQLAKSPEKGGQSPDKAKESSSEEVGGDEKPKLVQKEAGIGPVRILKRKAPLNFDFGTNQEKDDKSDEKKETPSARVVQRQETCGGKSIRVILNVRLVPKTCNVSRRGDKFVQLNAPNSDGTLESSLFRVKTTAEADQLENKLKAMLQQ